MAKKKTLKKVTLKKDMFSTKRTSLVKQEVYAEDPKLSMSVETMPIEECADSITMDEMPYEELLPEEPWPECPMDEVPMGEEPMDEVRMVEPRPASPAEELDIGEPPHSVGVEDVAKEIFLTCGSKPKRPGTSRYTKPPVRLLIGPEEIIHYVPRHLLPQNLDQSGSSKQLYLRDMDIGTAHTFIHYLHTGLYETTNAEGDITVLTTSAKFKQALSVYRAAIYHDIPCLKELAITEMRTHASGLDLVEFIHAIAEGFQSLGPESWVHGYLQQKTKTAFEENNTIFTSEAFLDTLNNSKVNKFMMRCMAECYDDKIANMGSREIEMVEILSACQQSLRLLSYKKVVLEQNISTQHQFITPLANGTTISECCEIGTSRDDLLSDEDFCTISCPPSECSNGPRDCRKFTNGSAKPREHSQVAKKFPYEDNIAGLMPCEQRSPPTHLAPDLSVESSYRPTSGSAAEQCGGKPKRSHCVLEPQASKDAVSAPLAMDEKKTEKKETKKQRKMREKKELQEMRELWERMKQNRRDTAAGVSDVPESEAKPDYQDEVHKGPTWHARGDDKHIKDLQAALTAVLNDVESRR